MKFHEPLGAPVVPNPARYIEVTDEKVEYRTWGKTRFSTPLKDVRVVFDPQGVMGAVGGYGEVQVSENSLKLGVITLVDAKGFYEYVQKRQTAVRKDQPAATAGAQEQREATQPVDCRFSRSILILPQLETGMLSGWLWSLPGIVGQNGIAGAGVWVNRNDPLCSWQIRLPRSAVGNVSINSPVSGLVLDLGLYQTKLGGWCAILLPEGEPEPLPLGTIYSNVRKFAWQHRNDIYRDAYRRGAAPELDRRLKNEFETAISASYSFRDIGDGYIDGSPTPTWAENFPNIIHDRPQLAPLLTPLINQGERRSESSDTQRSAVEPPISNQTPTEPTKPVAEDRDAARDEEVQAQDQWEDIIAAATRFGLAARFTEQELEAAYRARRLALSTIAPEQISECDKDYQILLRFSA